MVSSRSCLPVESSQRLLDTREYPAQNARLTHQVVLPAIRFVLENSGVAEPQNIRDKFSEAIAMGNPLMSRIQLDTMVTIVDSGSFTADYSSRTPVSGATPVSTCLMPWYPHTCHCSGGLILLIS